MYDKAAMLAIYSPLIELLNSIPHPACVRLAGDMGQLIKEIRAAEDQKILADLNEKVGALSLRARHEIEFDRLSSAGRMN